MERDESGGRLRPGDEALLTADVGGRQVVVGCRADGRHLFLVAADINGSGGCATTADLSQYWDEGGGLAFGLLPAGARSAQVISQLGEQLFTTSSSGVWLAELPKMAGETTVSFLSPSGNVVGESRVPLAQKRANWAVKWIRRRFNLGPGRP